MKISELKKGEYARIHGMFSEVLAASGLDAERFYVKARCFKTGIVFEDKPLPSKEVDLPAFSRKEYMLVSPARASQVIMILILLLVHRPCK